MIDVEQGGLGALEEDAVAAFPGGQQVALGVADEGQEGLGGTQQALDDGLQGGQAAFGPEAQADFLVAGPDALGQGPGMAEVAQADAHAGGLHLVGGPDAAARGADLGAHLVGPDFAPLIQGDVVRQDDVGLLGEQEAAREVEPARPEPIQFLLEDLEVQHHAVADHQEAPGMQGAAGHLMQGDALAIHHHGVSGVVAALEADHMAEAGAEQVHDLALAFVPPLEAKDRQIGPSQAHVALPSLPG